MGDDIFFGHLGRAVLQKSKFKVLAGKKRKSKPL
jgi:hypothetical protein